VRALGLARDRDTQCGLKGVAASAVPTVVVPLATAGYAFDVELLARAHRSGLRVAAVPVTWSHVSAGTALPLGGGVTAARDAWRLRPLARGQEGGEAAG
jgi:dolichyl-phosphate beta-glucosyltransferase